MLGRRLEEAQEGSLAPFLRHAVTASFNFE
jgi:hypothetical protein